MGILKVKDLRKIYHTKNNEILAVDNFSLNLKQGEFIALLDLVVVVKVPYFPYYVV